MVSSSGAHTHDRKPEVANQLLESMLPLLPLIQELLEETLPSGVELMVEYDPTSLWYDASLTMAAGWLEQEGTVEYSVGNQPPENIRAQLKKLGVNVEKLEELDKLAIIDWYSATLGHKSKEKYHVDSLKVADLSIRFGEHLKVPEPRPSFLTLNDDWSFGSRFNDEKDYLHFILTRGFRTASPAKTTEVDAFMKGVHSDSFYRQLQAAANGVIEFKFDDTGEKPRNIMRIKGMRNMRFDANWHEIMISANSRVTIMK